LTAALASSRTSRLSPINQRRLAVFKANRRGLWSFWIFAVLFVLTLGAEFIANDRPILAMYKGELLVPALVNYPEAKFGGFLAETAWRDPVIADEVNAHGWMVWPPIRYGYTAADESLAVPAPSPPALMQTNEQRCGAYPQGVSDPACTIGNWHWLGTDDQGRDVLARLIYGFRVSVLFGFTLAAISSVIGIVAGGLQGYFGGWLDLIAQRAIEIWTALPALYLLLIISSIIAPSFWSLLGILLLFSWTALVGIVRAEFLRARNFEYVAAARALGVSDLTIMVRHMLPNAMVATLTFMPFIISGSVTTLTALDFLGFGLPAGSPSLGELLSQGKDNIYAPWLGITGFAVLSIILTLLVFIGEAVRDAFDPRRILK
jgi:microcin C transport system permease protein